MTLDSNTKVTIGAAVACVGLFVGTAFAGIWMLSSVLTRMEFQIGELSKNQYSLPAAAEVALRQAILNPGMRVVDPRDPSKMIVVDGVK